MPLVVLSLTHLRGEGMKVGAGIGDASGESGLSWLEFREGLEETMPFLAEGGGAVALSALVTVLSAAGQVLPALLTLVCCFTMARIASGFGKQASTTTLFNILAACTLYTAAGSWAAAYTGDDRLALVGNILNFLMCVWSLTIVLTSSFFSTLILLLSSICVGVIGAIIGCIILLVAVLAAAAVILPEHISVEVGDDGPKAHWSNRLNQ
jgi:hypothetical protein